LSIEIDWIWLLITALGVLIYAFTAGKSKLESLSDMVSCRLYVTGLFLSIMLLLVAVLISEMSLPLWSLDILGKLTSMVVGTFLTVVLAKLILDICSNQVSFVSQRTFKGILLISTVLIFVFFVNSLGTFSEWMGEYVHESALQDPSLSLVGSILGWFTVFATFFFYRDFILPRLEKICSKK
jgi:hypothetical protein